MFSPSDILKRSSDKLGFRRVVYKLSKIPTSIDNIVILPFFGDIRSSFILSSLLLRRIKEEAKSSKYFILISWPGYESLYPYVDEYWTIEDQSILEKLTSNTEGFSNVSSYYTLLVRGLNEWFYDVLTDKDFNEYYRDGITKEFFDKFKHIKVSLPNINSSSYLGVEFSRIISNKELKIFLYPSKIGYGWRNGKESKVKINKNFWINLSNYLIKEGYFPIIYRDLFCYDISIDINKDCVHIWDSDLSKVFASIRASGFVLDYFSGISNFALCCRTPFLCFDERSRFNGLKQYEIDDLCGKDILKEYIFSFSTILDSDDNQWDQIFLESTVSKLNKIFPRLNKDNLPSTIESNKIVPYEIVRKIKNKKMGSRFIKIKKE